MPSFQKIVEGLWLFLFDGVRLEVVWIIEINPGQLVLSKVACFMPILNGALELGGRSCLAKRDAAAPSGLPASILFELGIVWRVGIGDPLTHTFLDTG